MSVKRNGPRAGALYGAITRLGLVKEHGSKRRPVIARISFYRAVHDAAPPPIGERRSTRFKVSEPQPKRKAQRREASGRVREGTGPGRAWISPGSLPAIHSFNMPAIFIVCSRSIRRCAHSSAKPNPSISNAAAHSAKRYPFLGLTAQSICVRE